MKRSNESLSPPSNGWISQGVNRRTRRSAREGMDGRMNEWVAPSAFITILPLLPAFRLCRFALFTDFERLSALQFTFFCHYSAPSGVTIFPFLRPYWFFATNQAIGE